MSSRPLGSITRGGASSWPIAAPQRPRSGRRGPVGWWRSPAWPTSRRRPSSSTGRWRRAPSCTSATSRAPAGRSGCGRRWCGGSRPRARRCRCGSSARSCSTPSRGQRPPIACWTAGCRRPTRWDGRGCGWRGRGCTRRARTDRSMSCCASFSWRRSRPRGTTSCTLRSPTRGASCCGTAVGPRQTPRWRSRRRASCARVRRSPRCAAACRSRRRCSTPSRPEGSPRSAGFGSACPTMPRRSCGLTWRSMRAAAATRWESGRPRGPCTRRRLGSTGQWEIA